MYLRDSKPMLDSMHEECGVFGVYSAETRDVANTVYYGLYALQHRGQESCGIAVAYANKVEYYKGMGLIPDVFSGGALASLPEGDIAVGHVRYSTTGASLLVNAQPIVFTGKCGKMALAHNGNLTNTDELRADLIADNAVFQTTIDSEAMAMLINKYSDGDIVRGVLRACECFKGSYALVVMTADKLIAVRDPYGIRPLCVGELMDDVVVASESCALDAVGANFLRDVEPGEVLVVDSSGMHSYHMECKKKCKSAACIFEWVYFSRPDSILDGGSVYQTRMLAGKILAENYPVDADIVSGVPDSALVAARGYSQASGIPYVEALEKKPLRRQNLHSARPEDARKQRQRQNEPLEGKYSGQAAGADRRLDRAWHHVEADRAHAEKRGRERGARAHMFARDQTPLPSRHRYAVVQPADRRQQDGKRNLRVSRRGFAEISDGGTAGGKLQRRENRVLPRLFQRGISLQPGGL